MKTWRVFVLIAIWLAASTCSQAVTADSTASDSQTLVQVKVDRLIVDPASHQPVVSLVDKDEKRAFPIWIGLSEARAIHSELQGVEHSRPLTHDLLARVITKTDGNIQRVVITHIEDNIFFATLVIKKGDTLIEIDARPSDSIVMALKFKAPIYIDRSLFEKMAIAFEAPRKIGEDYGLSLQEVTAELAAYLSLEAGQGVMVSAVGPGSRAEKDGIQPGDILFEINGSSVADVTSARDLIEKSKGSLDAKIMREKQILNITLNVR